MGRSWGRGLAGFSSRPDRRCFRLGGRFFGVFLQRRSSRLRRVYAAFSLVFSLAEDWRGFFFRWKEEWCGEGCQNLAIWLAASHGTDAGHLHGHDLSSCTKIGLILL